MKKPVKFENIHKDLIEACLNGNRRAQYEIYKLYYRAMFNSCVRIVNNVSEAEDIMQEAFLKTFFKLSEYKGDVSFGAWLKKIVINQSIDFIRSRKIIYEPLENKMNEIAEETENEETISGIEPELIFKEIENLPESYRIILSLYLIEDYNHKEIAEMLNISSSTSRSQYARAKKKLINNLKKKS